MQSDNQLIEAFLGKSHIRETSTAQWAEILAAYPAFTLGHYFQAKQQAMTETETKTEANTKSDQASTVRQTAARHFNDIRWLDYLLKTAETAQPEKQQTTTASAKTTTQTADNKVVQKPITQKATPSPSENGLVDATTPVVTDQPDKSRLSAVLSAQLADFKKPVDQDARLEVQRDPLYKVDYFASQGVSILVNQDGFDRKVRKFTDWLKEMKQQNMDPSAPKLNTTPQEEAQAAQKAEASLKSEPIWTESMAEVLASQGKAAQARSVYQKLSLLYPEKSAYFASKIDLLQ